MADLAWLRARGLAPAIERAAREGRIVLALCGGFQMLGERLADPDSVETGGEAPGLALLPASTTFTSPKTTVRVRARASAHGPFAAAAGAEITGYEIHAGVTLTRGPAALTIVERGGVTAETADGAVAGSVVGTYIHGLLACAPLRRALLVAAARRRGVAPDPRWGARGGSDRYDRLADLVGPALDLDAITRLVRRPVATVGA